MFITLTNISSVMHLKIIVIVYTRLQFLGEFGSKNKVFIDTTHVGKCHTKPPQWRT